MRNSSTQFQPKVKFQTRNSRFGLLKPRADLGHELDRFPIEFSSTIRKKANFW